MKKKILLVLTLLLIFTLTGCFGNYKVGYKLYSKKVGNFELYYKDLEDDEACPKETGYLYTLYSTDGNTFKYKGIRSGDGCYVELLADAGTGLTTVSNLLKDEKITVKQLEDVSWTFNFVIDQTPDHKIGAVNFIEYFEEIGDYEVFIIDNGTTLCHSAGAVNLYEYNGVQYDVQGAPSGDGCVSEYYIYYEEESDDADSDADTVEGELMTVQDAFVAGYISVPEIHNATFESDIFRIYTEQQILVSEATIYFVNETQTYNQTNPYILSLEERTMIASILATTKYQYAIDEEEQNTLYTTLIDDERKEHKFQIYDTAKQESIETVQAILTLTDSVGNSFIYCIYNTGIQIITDELDVYADFLYQTYITDLLQELDE